MEPSVAKRKLFMKFAKKCRSRGGCTKYCPNHSDECDNNPTLCYTMDDLVSVCVFALSVSKELSCLVKLLNIFNFDIIHKLADQRSLQCQLI